MDEQRGTIGPPGPEAGCTMNDPIPDRAPVCVVIGGTGGIEALARSAAATHVGRRLRSNVVAPAPVDTPLTRAISPDPRTLAASRAMHSLGRIGRPDDVAAAIAPPLDPANDRITGQILSVDGRMSSVLTRQRA